MLARARLTALLALAVSAESRSAWADERIEDPELTGDRKPAEAPGAAPTPAAAGDERIEDPELGGAKPATDSGGFSNRPEYPHDAVLRVTLGTRWGMDTHWTGPSQDIVEGTSIASVEMEQRRSEVLLVSLGLRARYAFGMRKSGTTITELDAVPISGFADVTPTAGYHVRVGYQVTELGRFDLFNATNVLAVYDLRSGPLTMNGAAAVGQPAVRFDYDGTPGFALQAYYVPFVVPHLVSVYGTNYSLFTPFDRAADALGADRSAETSLVRQRTAGLAKGGLDAFAPAPNFTKPQGAVRATVSGSSGELSATVATAVEHLPTLGVNTTTTNPAEVIDPHYDRFGLFSVDGATDAGPVQLGFELAYMMHRTLPSVAFQTLGTPPVTGWFPGPPGHTDMAQAGLHGELVLDATALEAEAFGIVALNDAPGGGAWPVLQHDRWLGGIAGGVHYEPEGSPFKAELGGAFILGPTALLLPRVEWQAVHTVYLELGAVLVTGPTPAWNSAVSYVAGPALALGGLYRDVVNVFTGVRWVP